MLIRESLGEGLTAYVETANLLGIPSKGSGGRACRKKAGVARRQSPPLCREGRHESRYLANKSVMTLVEESQAWFKHCKPKPASMDLVKEKES